MSATIWNLWMYYNGNLTELMIAAFVSFLVMAACVKSYLSMHSVLLLQQSLQAEESKALVVINLLNSEIAKAGLRGCYPVDESAVKVNSSFISVSYQDYPGVNLQANGQATTRIIVDKILHYHKGQVLMISDCQHAEFFTIASLHIKYGKQVITPLQPLKYAYQNYAEIGTYVTHQYFVTNNRLVCADLLGHLQTIVTGIYHLQFREDDQGVSYQFDTKHQNKYKTWFAYVRKNTR